MGISRSNFRYAGSSGGSNNNAHPYKGTLYWARYAGAANGAALGIDTGGEAAFGSVVPMSYLDGTAHAAAGDYCLGYMFGQASMRSRASYNQGEPGIFAAYVTTGSDSGAHYPVDASPAAGTFVAYSVRAFLRVDDPNSSVNDAHAIDIGASIGVHVKSVHPGTNQVGNFQASPTGSLSASFVDNETNNGADPWFIRTNFHPRMTGYCLSLTSMQDDGDSNGSGQAKQGFCTGSAGPRLRFSAHEVNSINHTANTPGVDSYHETVANCDFDTWYHIRMDVTPNVGNDVIEIYTAPIANALGSESWTKHTTITIDSTDPWYRPWDSTGSTYKTNGVGFFAANNVSHSDTYLQHDVFIDGFEFFTKDVS